ncbi:MAG: hypothetical protein BMS9Abin29_1543 [Gemmatimonadota bacterium]|nr:MAG: hypothetical protein BMS9Abin29_1543 [Gemmatimonadota bacterium]
MSHITDGDLHAYLDKALDAGAYGPAEAERIRAHLEGCAACAQRLDAERALRERATGILENADPGAVPLASFEELKARAAVTGGPSDRTSKFRLSWRSPYAIGLGWAATIALALWAGYSVKDFAPNPSGRSPVVSEPMRAREAAAADDQPGELDRKNDQAQASEVEAAAVTEAPGLVSSERAVRSRAGAPAAVPAEVVEDQDVAIDPAVRKEVAPADQPPASSREDFAAAPSNETGGVAGRVLDARKTLEQELSREGATAVDGLLLLSGERGSADVPGLDIRRIETVELPGIGPATLIVHVLPDGGDLELWSLSNSELAAASPRTAPEQRVAELAAYFRNSLPLRWSMSVQERSGGYLVARGPLPQDELDALMERVLDGG